ncbi:hypothetical protein GJ496_004425 [Pomphorhynchus laevis]|nr:hypothetical protein GJ496_004425 [Pomphorhynchus laevis]
MPLFFGSTDFKSDQHMNTSLRNHGIDLKQVIDSFEKLRSMNTVVETMVVDNMSKMLLSLPRYPAGLEALRVYIILPFCHIFENMKYLDNIINRFTNAVNLLSPFASNVIDQWYDQGHTTFFDRALQIFKPLVMYILRLPQSSDQDEIYKYRMMLRSTLDFLGRLHRICNSSSNEIASYDAFYIPELSQIIDVQYDYLEWIGRGGTLQPSGPITFCDYPFVFDGVAKCRLLQIDARLKRQVFFLIIIFSNFAHAFGFGGSPELPVLRLLISRNRILHDTIDQLKYCVPEDLKKPLKVTFIGEEGVDAGGVKKEFFLLLMRELLDPKYGMFIHYDDTHCIWFNEFSFEEDDMYNLVGKICALAIYNEIIIDLPFPPVLYKKLLNDARLTLEDLKDLSATTYRGFKEMLNYTKNDFQDVFCLTMSVEKDAFGKITTVDLINNGRNIPVTLENANEYVQAYIEHLFNASVEQQFRQFYNGFHQVMSSAILRMFQPAELMTMIVGTRNYDFDLIQKYVRYEGVFYADHQVIKWFWDVIREFSSKEKKLFLVFLTGTDRFPMVGLNTFRIIIHPTYGGDEYFPVAHTCFNRLDLPVYSSKAILKAKLSEAIQHDKGFTLA